MSGRLLVAGTILLSLLSVPSTVVEAQPNTDSVVAAGLDPAPDAEVAVNTLSQETPAPTTEIVLPRLMRPFYHVFAAFGLAWALILGYVVSVRRRIDRLEAEVQRLLR